MTIERDTRLLEYCQYAGTRALSRLEHQYYMKTSAFFPAEMDALVLRVHAMVLGEKSAEPDVITYPANWLEAVKDRFTTAWLRKRWPVRYVTHTITHKITYPNVPCKDIQGPYVPFMIHHTARPQKDVE